MNQESPPNDPQSSPTPPSTPTPPPKPPRSPVERIIVWGVILVGAGVAAWEARAKFGYDGTREKIEARAKDEGGEEFKPLTLGEVKGFASGGAVFSEMVDGTLDKKITLTWPSLFKTYAITLNLAKDDDQKDDELIVMGFETATPPEPEPVVVDDTDPAGGGPGAGGPGGGGPGGPGPGGPGPGGPGGGGPGGGGPGPGGPGGGGGGGRGGPRGVMALVQADDVQAALSVTEEQNEKIAALQEQLGADGPDFRSMIGRLQEAGEEEQGKILTEIRKAREEMDAQAKEGLAGILDEGQMTRLQQIEWQIQGARSLASAEAMAQLNLSDEQKSKMAEIEEQYGEARRELGFRASAEDRAKFNEEYDAKFQDVLTDEQKQAWQKMQGEKFERSAVE